MAILFNAAGRMIINLDTLYMHARYNLYNELCS